MLRFNDGVSVDTSGRLRVIHMKDGYYVTGEGYLIPVDSRAEGEQTIAEMKAETKRANHVDGYDRDDLGCSPDY